MPYQPDESLNQYFQQLSPELPAQLDTQLQRLAPSSPNLSLYRDMLLTVMRMAADDRNRWNAKITLQALRELEHAFRVLEQYKARRKVTVFGSARTPIEHPMYSMAKALGTALAQAELMVITGAGGGIMAAAHEGAGQEHSLGFNITLPFEQHANATMEGSDRLLPFHFFFIRKLFFVKEADALVLCPGGFGTLDEALEVLTLIQTGKSPLVPLILLDTPGSRFWQDALDFFSRQLEGNAYILPNDLKLMRLVYSVEEAVEEIQTFYSNFHSTRWLKRQFVIRSHRPLSEDALKCAQDDFADLCLNGGFEQENAEGDQDDTEFGHLTRLVFNFNGRDQGRLRQLVDFINQPAHWASASSPTTPQLKAAQATREPVA